MTPRPSDPDRSVADRSPTERSPTRTVALGAHLPWLLTQLGRGMMLPIVPLYLRDAGMSYTLVSVVLASLGLGAVLGGLPVGAAAGRFGAELLFVGAAVATAITTVLFGVSTAVFALVAFRLVYGAGAVGVRVAIQMLVNEATPAHRRGRAMALMGGGIRVAYFAGPLLGGFLVDATGFTTTFAAAGAMTLLGLVPFFAARRERPDGARFGRPAIPISSLFGALAHHRGLLLLAGTGMALVMTVREGRDVVVPLIGDDLGLSATAVGALVAIGTGADLLLFPLAGWLMDRFGRLAAVVPAFGLLGAGMLVLGSTDTATGAVVAGVVMGVGNGMGAGVLLTIGADLAPRDAGPFLAALGMSQDIGVIVGPVIVGWLADTAGLHRSAIVLGFVMFAAVGWIVVVLGNTAHPTRPWIVSRLDRPHR